jgi:hypothetical protein
MNAQQQQQRRTGIAAITLATILSFGTMSGCAPSLITLQVQALPEGASAPIRLELDGRLHSGDQYRLEVHVPRPAYVYVMQPGNPQPKTLFPQQAGQDNRATPTAPFYVPSLEQFMALDNQVGTERLIVVVTVQPLSTEALHKFVKEQDEMTSRGTDPPPGTIGPTGKDPTRYVVKGAFDAQQRAILRFSFQHERPQS